MEMDVEGKEENIDLTEGTMGQRKRCCCFHMSKNVHDGLINFLTFKLHLFIVLAILFGGAIIFAHIEELGLDTLFDFNITFSNLESNAMNSSHMEEVFWKEVEEGFSLTISHESRENLTATFRSYIADKDKAKDFENRTECSSVFGRRMQVYFKWLHFAIVASTTIGYGDVSPQTQLGRLAFIPFVVFGAILVMWLLVRCGAIISFINNFVFAKLQKYGCKKLERWVTSELLTLLSLLLILGVFLLLGIWYGHMMDLGLNWTWIDSIYYWFVTFSTVGFGDLLIPVEDEFCHFYFYTIYRLFGLALIAAIIDAINVWLAKRKLIKEGEDSVQNAMKKLNKLKNLMPNKDEMKKMEEKYLNVKNQITSKKLY